MNNKKLIYFSIVFVSAIVILFFMYNNKKFDSNQSKILPTLTTESIKQLSKSNSNQQILYDNNTTLVESKITQVSLEQDVIYNNSWSIWSFYKDLKSNLITNIARWTNIEDLLDNLWDVSVQEKHLKITVYQKDGKTPLEWVNLYLRWNFVWISDENGIVDKTLNIPKYFNYYYFQANKSWYWWWFKKRSDMYYDWYEIYDNIVLHDAAQTVKWNTSKVQFKTKDVEFESNEDCILLDVNWNCYNWEFTVDMKRLRGDQVDEAWIYMEAVLPDWTFTNLISNWMAFLIFYDIDNNKLIYNKDKLSKICYNVRPEDISSRDNRETQLDNVEWYWWFDIQSWYWHFDTEANVTLEWNKWCAETKYIY